PGTNLLQGEYAPKSNLAPLLKPWRAAAGLLLGLVLVSFAAQAAEYLSLRQQSRALEATLTEICRRDFSVSVDACERAVRQRLNDAGVAASGTSFLAALSAIAEARTPNSRISALQYSAGRPGASAGAPRASGRAARAPPRRGPRAPKHAPRAAVARRCSTAPAGRASRSAARMRPGSTRSVPRSSAPAYSATSRFDR